jgi:hypothetical protein
LWGYNVRRVHRDSNIQRVDRRIFVPSRDKRCFGVGRNVSILVGTARLAIGAKADEVVVARVARALVIVWSVPDQFVDRDVVVDGQ